MSELIFAVYYLFLSFVAWPFWFIGFTAGRIYRGFEVGKTIQIDPNDEESLL